MTSIEYTVCYPYRLSRTLTVATDITPPHRISTAHLQLTPDGQLTITEGYCWDGPSGPAIHTQSFMRGSLVHDALYHLMRRHLLDRETWRDVADRTLQNLCVDDGMWPIRARWVYWAVRLFGWRVLV